MGCILTAVTQIQSEAIMPYADPVQRRQYHRERQRLRRERGRCVNCSREALPGLTRCVECRADHAVRNALRRGPPPLPTRTPSAAEPAWITAPGTGPASASAPAQTAGELIMDPHADPDAIRLTDLVLGIKEARLAWDRNRPDLRDQSASSYCKSLADIAIRAGWSDQEVVNLLICWRRKHGEDLKIRERYYELTLARAKEPIQMEREQRRLEETLTQIPRRTSPRS